MLTPRWRIWLITDVYPPECGGSGWSTHALARVLLDRGHDVAVISVAPGHAGVTKRTYDGIEVTEVGVARARRSPRRRLGAHDYSYEVLSDYLTRRLATEPETSTSFMPSTSTVVLQRSRLDVHTVGPYS